MNKNIILNAVELFIMNNKKPLLLTGQLNKVESLKNYINLSEEHQLKTLISAYIDQDESSLIHILTVIKIHSQISEQLDQSVINKKVQNIQTTTNQDAKQLIEENSGLREALLKIKNEITMNLPSSIAKPEINRINLSELTLLENDNNMAKSAHDVKKYRYNNTLYFVKQFGVVELEQKREDAIAEIIYSHLWRYFIGKAASESVLVIGANNDIIGIASKGLNGFESYKKMLNKEEFNIPQGFISVLLYAALLKEQDLHIENIGSCEIDDQKFFAKIDHDFIVDKWSELLTKSPVDLDNLARALAKNAILDFFDAIDTMRFSPTHKDPKILRAAHGIRSRFTDRPKTTTSGSDKNKALNEAISCVHLNEFIGISDRFRTRSILESFDDFIEEVVHNLKAYPSYQGKALAILGHMNQQVQALTLKAALYSTVYKESSQIISANHGQSQYSDIVEQLDNYRVILIKNLEEKICRDNLSQEDLLNDSDMIQLKRVLEVSDLISKSSSLFSISKRINDLGLSDNIKLKKLSKPIGGGASPVPVFHHTTETSDNPRVAFSIKS
ncbi:MAG: hypothetical protein EP298_10450 [Gammaproteobacteria bacterium]|nr:MAG: hypothetical protein EP298_10450 [Gammaproteobacteria bacterium]UTW42192.1 hypothetical protein KFE69_11970 [bacterium SCSIO 12844]